MEKKDFTHPPCLPFLLLCCSSHFYATRNEIRQVHTNEQIDQNCAINYGIQLNGRNKPTIKYENLLGIKSISEFIQRFARYKTSSLISVVFWKQRECKISVSGQTCYCRDTVWRFLYQPFCPIFLKKISNYFQLLLYSRYLYGYILICCTRNPDQRHLLQLPGWIRRELNLERKVRS